VKAKDFVPVATRYNTARELLDPKKGKLTSKGKRKMFSEEIEDLAKKYKKPDPGAYEVNIKEKSLGALNLKDERTTFADEANYLGKKVVPPYDAKYDIVFERTRTAKFLPISKGKDDDKSDSARGPSPITYDVDGSFKKSQLIKPRFFIPKGKIISLPVQASNQKKFVPPPGAYDIDKSYKVMTKGAAKGYK